MACGFGCDIFDCLMHAARGCGKGMRGFFFGWSAASTNLRPNAQPLLSRALGITAAVLICPFPFLPPPRLCRLHQEHTSSVWATLQETNSSGWASQWTYSSPLPHFFVRQKHANRKGCVRCIKARNKAKPEVCGVGGEKGLGVLQKKEAKPCNAHIWHATRCVALFPPHPPAPLFGTFFFDPFICVWRSLCATRVEPLRGGEQGWGIYLFLHTR